MADPNVYLLHGEDDYAIASMLREIQSGLGDPVLLDMNTARLDGRSNTFDQLVQAVNSLPFLAARRLVIFNHPTSIVRHPTHQKKLFDILSKMPSSTMLVMMEDEPLLPKDKKKDPRHWLDKWASEAGPAVMVKLLNLPVGPQLNQWIIARVKDEGGQITPPAAKALADAIGPDPRILKTEIQKLLAYVNYIRPVETDDVQHVTTTIQRVENFALVNALRAHNLQLAQKALHIELTERDAIPVFASIVSQFRNLLLARETLDHGGSPEELVRAAKVHPYVARLAMDQARTFTLNELEEIYHRLIEVDELMKGGSSVSPDVSLEVLVTQLTFEK